MLSNSPDVIVIDRAIINNLITQNNSIELNELFESLQCISQDIAHLGRVSNDIEEKDNCINKLGTIITVMIYLLSVSGSIDNIFFTELLNKPKDSK
ncbi:MAG: hypothetical protein ACYCZO_10100 [Daejeonella sp.]